MGTCFKFESHSIKIHLTMDAFLCSETQHILNLWCTSCTRGLLRSKDFSKLTGIVGIESSTVKFV